MAQMGGSGEHYIPCDQLRVGHYIRLEMSWLDHPFSFNSFQIRSQAQLSEVLALGLTRIRIDPSRSQVGELAPPAAAGSQPGRGGEVATVRGSPAETAAEPIVVTPEQERAIAEKHARIERNREVRTRINACEREFMQAANVCRDLTKNLFADPKKALGSATTLVSQLTESLMMDKDVMVHLLNDKVAGEEVYYHSLNVAMLSLLLGRALEMEPAVLNAIGVAALFHDIGKADVPDKILLKKEGLTRAEEDFYRQHCAYGLDMGRKAGLPDPVLQVIAFHHEMVDGSGYPKGLKGDAIPPLARLVGMINAYDNLCNPVNLATAVTPHEALSTMYAKHRAKYDADMLGRMIQILGVYPPGTVVRLSNDAFGMVLSINSARPLRPVVMIYDPEVPKEEAIIIDLAQEEEANIARAIRPAQLPRQIYDYLSPRKRVTYYFEPGKGGPVSKP